MKLGTNPESAIQRKNAENQAPKNKMYNLLILVINETTIILNILIQDFIFHKICCNQMNGIFFHRETRDEYD